ncbi:hypothetical protein [Streptomyces sp. NPDC048057]|uniref:hypothetical protein n=1 Tax=Streptomyces sp. NPDC048057 TaxID=3155628 RepID=UPI00341166CB
MVLLLLAVVVVLSLADIAAINHLPSRPWPARRAAARPVLAACSCGRPIPAAYAHCPRCTGGGPDA